DLRGVLLSALCEGRHADDELVPGAVPVDLPVTRPLDRADVLHVRRIGEAHLDDGTAGEVHAVVGPGPERGIEHVPHHRAYADQEQGGGNDVSAAAPGQERIVRVLEDAHEVARSDAEGRGGTAPFQI